ncbi:hypothetical protein CkaCkLH20_01206 [Colletotrichum karsti]|uniref:DNA (cytosine-5)-methyltransferase 1 replication foci domain-containing protein n=1 Tax=Colletotrichum karsti TaxID=1095194 RepID=A0A9P6LQ05_9PEZI|nr:uncharacterized protein CkaCkLH20_01206 [Colletotrichum karsti]KAF9881056.1 hypothetical protein CkaCkLH20_01206 [Colletotrichum karsti]
MFGRRRRTSDSTTGTLDHDSHAYTNELNVLKKFDRSLKDADALQTFVLEDATIYDRAGRTVELFTVGTKGPFTVRGRVLIDGEQKKRAKNPATKSALIETKLCTRYAIGSIDSEVVTYGAWAGGECGWYEIQPPSALYRPIFDHTIEGISIYYGIMMAIEEHQKDTESGKKGKKRGRKASPKELTIETLLFKYAVAVGDGATYDEVVSRCDEHAPFLISHFYEDSPNFDWSPTVFFKWMVGRHRDIHTTVLESRKKKAANAAIKEELPEETESIAPPVASDEPPAQKALSKRRQRSRPDVGVASDDVDTPDVSNTSQVSIRSRSRAKTQAQSRSPPSTSPAVTQAASVEAMDVDAVPLTLPQRPAQNQPSGEQSNIDLILQALEELRPELEPLSKSSLSKVSSKIYYRHSIKHYKGSSEILSYYAQELLERLDEDAWGGSKFWGELQDIAAGPRKQLENISLEQVPSQLTRRKAKTVKAELNEPRDMAALATPPPKRVGRPAGKMSALRLVGSKGSKRRFDSTDGTPDTVSRGSKAAKISHPDDSENDEGMEDDNVDDGASSSIDDDSEIDTNGSPSALKVVVRAENLPTTDAKGPNGTWVCDEEGCGFLVRNAEQDEGRERIQEHIQEAHYEDENRDARIDLAVTEGVKNHLPIDHLLEKIRQMGERVLKKEETTIDEVPVPQPIKRRLIS